MTRKHFSLVDILVSIGMLTLFINGIVILSTQVLSVHKQHRVSAARLTTEDLLAQRWQEFVGKCDATESLSVKSETLQSGDHVASIDQDGIWLDGVLTPLPKSLTASFAKDDSDPGLLVLALTDDNSHRIRIVARQSQGEKK